MRALLLALVPLAVSAQNVVPFSEATRERRDTCVTHASERVCLRAVGDEDEGQFEAVRRGRTARWTAASHPMSVYLDLRVFRVELAPRGGALFIAERKAVSNGVAVEAWTLYVLPDDADAPTYRFDAQDIGYESAPFATWDGETVYWATEWQDADDPSGRRGTGFYLVGRPFRLGHDGLMPVTGLPIRSRRMLYNFRREAGGPISWLADRRAETRRRDPYWAGRPSGEVGEITEVRPGDYGTYTVTVRVESRERSFSVGESPWDEGSARLGDGATGRILPDTYRPTALVGRRVRVGDGPEQAHVLWLD